MSKETAWENVKQQFLTVLREHGLDEATWDAMRSAAVMAEIEGGGPEGREALKESFRAKYLDEGRPSEEAERMAEIAARGHSYSPTLSGNF